MDIPGYRIQREIGRGGSSRVYLALQHTFGSPVAIKVLSPEASRRPEQREDFLTAGRIALKLDHPNIVRVLDVGETPEVAYLAMEYVRGGDLNRNLRTGLHMQNVLAVVKEIASALDYAHGKGVVHGDVKPENILIGEQGTSFLSDFGIATTAGRSIVSATVRGTRGYMSPEQLVGRGIDGRSDLFSLGVVFYLMLTGRLPFEADSRAGIQPMRDRLPSLPPHLVAFESVIQCFLARSPETRFASGFDVANALDTVRADDLVPNAVVKTGPVSTAEIAALGVRSEGTGAGVGARQSSRLRRFGAAAAALGVLAIAGAALYLGDESGVLQRGLAAAGVIEHPDVVVAWQAADALRQDPNQSLGTVVDAYREVLAIEPGRVDAQAAIDAFARQWKEDIGRMIDQGDLDTARDKIADLADTFADDPELTGLSDRLGDRSQAVELLEQSIRLLQSSGLGNVRVVDSAIGQLKQVLSLNPANPKALETLDGIAIYYANVATRRAGAADGPGAMDAVRRAERANTSFEGVDDVKATVAAAVVAHDAEQARLDDMLQQAAALRESGALVDAIEMYRSVLVIQPDAPVAVQGLAGTSSDILAKFETLLNEDRFPDASSLFVRATKAGIADDVVEDLRRLQDAKLKRIADVARLIDEAESFMQAGYVTGPDPENNAMARLRDALRLDADNADGIRLQSMAATRLADVAEDAYYAGMAEEGLEYLDLALAVTPRIDRWRQQRDRWQAEISANRATASDDAGTDSQRSTSPSSDDGS